MKITENVSNYEDYKYVIQDSGSIYVGARYSYEELLDAELVPFKLKAIIHHYILKETMPDTTLESQFYYLEPGTFLYEIYSQLKIKVKVQIRQASKNLFGKMRIRYVEKVYTLAELVSFSPEKKQAQQMMIQEVQFSKLAMMTFSV